MTGKPIRAPVTMKRRRFIQTGLSGLAALALPRPLLAPRTGRRGPGSKPLLVAVFLRGGLDALGTIIPYGEARYRELRPTIAIPQPGSDRGPSVIPLDKHFGLHPALAPLQPLFEGGRMTAILSAGSPHPTRSHFDAQDFMEYAVTGRKDIRTGWLNRYLAATAGRDQAQRLRAVALQPLLPRSLRGAYPVLAVPPRPHHRTDELLDLFGDLYRSSGEASTGKKAARDNESALRAGVTTIEAMRLYDKLQTRATPGRPKVAYPPGPLAAGLRGIAQLAWVDAGLEVACVDLNGWDHHTSEGGTGGRLAAMLGQLASSLAAFAGDLGPHFERTAVLLVSEFGRTARENGNAGTDHGHGGLMMLASGRLRAGALSGKWRGLRDDLLYEGRDLPVTTDFREIYSEVLREHLGWRPPRDFFPDYKPPRTKRSGSLELF